MEQSSLEEDLRFEVDLYSLQFDLIFDLFREEVLSHQLSQESNLPVRTSRRYFKSYTIINGSEKTHDTVILQTYLENMTVNQVQIFVPDVDDVPYYNSPDKTEQSEQNSNKQGY